eukprot:674391-Prymnesium_polylepis.1
MAERTYATLREAAQDEAIRLAPCQFVHEEADSGLPQLLDRRGASAVVFVYASCWPSVGPHLTTLSRTLAALLPIGSRVITVDKQLVSSDDCAAGDDAWSFKLLSTATRPNYNTFESVGYVYELVAAGERPAGTAMVL